MTGENNSNERSINNVSTDLVCLGSRQDALPVLAMRTQLQVPTLPTEQEIAYNKNVTILLQNSQGTV